MTITPDFLYELLPEIYRLQDAQQGRPLQALLALANDQYASLLAATAQWHDNSFIETCDPRLIPLLAKLVAARPIAGANVAPEAARSLVGNTIALRRRKGTVNALEQAIRASSGWPARIVPPKAGELGAEFHAQVWRLASQEAVGSSPGFLARNRYTFHPMGVDTQLFNIPSAIVSVDEKITPAHLPARITLKDLQHEIEWVRKRIRDGYLGETLRMIEIDVLTKENVWTPIPPEHFEAVSLERWSFPERKDDRFDPRAIIDPERGRIMFPERKSPLAVRVRYAQGFSADIGGGSYPRSIAPAPDGQWVAYVGDRLEPVDGSVFKTIAEALIAFDENARDGVIRIVDSHTYVPEVELHFRSVSKSAAAPACGARTLRIEALDGQRPCLHGNIHLHGSGCALHLIVDGLWLHGSVQLSGHVDLHLRHCTLHPASKHGAIRATGGLENQFRLAIEKCVLGAIRLPAARSELTIEDSIIDGAAVGGAIGGPEGLGSSAPGPKTKLRCVTVFGNTHVQNLEAKNVLFDGAVVVDDLENGFVLNSFVPGESMATIPAHDQCESEGKLVFTSRQFGHAGYAQLSTDKSPAILKGATNGSEMGAFNLLDQPQRERQLAIALKEYAPLGVGVKSIYET